MGCGTLARGIFYSSQWFWRGGDSLFITMFLQRGADFLFITMVLDLGSAGGETGPEHTNFHIIHVNIGFLHELYQKKGFWGRIFEKTGVRAVRF